MCLVSIPGETLVLFYWKICSIQHNNETFSQRFKEQSCCTLYIEIRTFIVRLISFKKVKIPKKKLKKQWNNEIFQHKKQWKTTQKNSTYFDVFD